MKKEWIKPTINEASIKDITQYGPPWGPGGRPGNDPNWQS
jgi:hypothetical protein